MKGFIKAIILSCKHLPKMAVLPNPLNSNLLRSIIDTKWLGS